MVTEVNFTDAVEEVKQSNQPKTLAEFIAHTLKDKIIEVYIGDSYEDVNYDDSTQTYPAVLIGKVVTAYAECLVLNCIYINQKTKKPQFGNIVCLNEGAVKIITEVDGNGSLKDTFLSTKDAKMIKNFFDGLK